MVKKKEKQFLILAGVGAAVYYFTQPKTEEDENDLFLAGAGGGTSYADGDVSDLGLTKKQISYIQDNFDSSVSDTEVSSFQLNDLLRNTVVTDISNIKAVESSQGMSTFLGTPTDIIYKKGNKVVGGSSFITNQSITASEAQRRLDTKDNLIATIALNSGGGSSKKSSKKKKSSSSSSSSKNYTPVSISTRKDKTVRDYENKNLVSTTKTKKQIEKENKAKKSFSSLFRR